MNTKIPGLGIAHLALKASDFEKSLAFYRDGLGMTPYIGWGQPGKRIQMLRFGDGAGILELFEAPTEQLPDMGRYVHFAYSVEDVEKAYETALAAGDSAQGRAARFDAEEGYAQHCLRSRSGQRADRVFQGDLT